MNRAEKNKIIEPCKKSLSPVVDQLLFLLFLGEKNKFFSLKIQGERKKTLTIRKTKPDIIRF
ncbi:Hypothetical protein Minf_2409 [Methylacidiphilum infernorum V4]|uniref:Uncharacterized protein n=1 Tax=Methylacidiphilum infernorum (isolate V4) TaxID=481448 RepID=B3E0Y6_METI4|nr:Hypothetical protein Minf_2409 [Methylacidiphilum infernorum V4]